MATPTSDDVSVVDTATCRVIATIPVGQQPRYLSFTPDGREGWVTNLGSRDIGIIDAEAKRVVARLAPGGRPDDVGFRRWSYGNHHGPGGDPCHLGQRQGP
jgi:YVTN family beta-propeller protein